MNPYDEPNATRQNGKIKVSRQIDWASIAMAIGVHVGAFILAMLATSIPELRTSEHWFARAIEVASLFILPATIGGLFLVRRINHRSIMNCVVYCLLMALLMNAILKFDSAAGLLEVASYRVLWPLWSAIVTFLSLAITRACMKDREAIKVQSD